MKLIVATPLAIITEADDIAHLRAEDETGAFGILPGHADFLTALSMSVVSWRDRKGAEHYLAVRGGMLEVRGGKTISIATREAVASDDLHHLETDVLTTFRQRSEEEAHRCAKALSRGGPADLPLPEVRARAGDPGGPGVTPNDGLDQ